MENTILDTTTLVTRELTDSELDTLCGGASHFIATLAALARNMADPSANCFVGDTNKVVWAK